MNPGSDNCPKNRKTLSSPSLKVEMSRHFWQHIAMRIGAFEIAEPVPELRDPHAFAMVRPWVDVGSVGTLTLNRLERHLASKELGRLARPGVFFDFTRYRPTMRMVDGQREVKIPNSIIRYAKTEEGRDYLFLHLLEPHSNGEDYTDSLLEVIKHFNVKQYCRIGAMYDAVPHTRPLLVSGTLGSVQPIRQVPNFKVRRSTYQGPTTIMNLLSDGIDKSDIEALSFMVHLPQYVQLEEDYAGTSRMIEVLSAVYDYIPADLAPLRRGQRQYRELSASLERNTELKDLIQQMEAYYDAQVDSEESAAEKSAPAATLSPEIERFLSELGERLDSEGEQ
jgi:hypothetical protein